MKNKIILILLIGLLSSCSTLKDYKQEDNTKAKTVTEVTEKTKKGGKTVLEIPNIRYKDTTIYNVNRETKTILSTRYDKQGNQKIECLEADFNEKFTRVHELIENDIKTRDLRKTDFNPQYIFYAIAVLSLILIIGLGFLVFIMIKMQKQVPELIAQITKEL